VIAGRRVLALIPARGGSKGIPGKNIRVVGGKPLLAYTAEAALAARCVDRVVVSTDDEAIADAARAAGCDVPFMRPAELASDTAGSVDVALHALSQLPGYDVLVLLQPTSPLRTADDVDAACALLANGAASCVSVCAVEEHPWWMYRIDGGRLLPLMPDAKRATRRQDLPAVYSLNGAIYAIDAKRLSEQRGFVGEDTAAYVMPAERSLDIDTPLQLAAFEQALQAGANLR
jgi:CMP-N,N'-diacetyllegionaminic acid synthase